MKKQDRLVPTPEYMNGYVDGRASVLEDVEKMLDELGDFIWDKNEECWKQVNRFGEIYSRIRRSLKLLHSSQRSQSGPASAFMGTGRDEASSGQEGSIPSSVNSRKGCGHECDGGAMYSDVPCFKCEQKMLRHLNNQPRGCGEWIIDSPISAHKCGFKGLCPKCKGKK